MKFPLNISTRHGLSDVVLGGAFVPALLIVIPLAVLVAVTESALEAERFPDTIVVMALIGALLTGIAYFVTTPGRQPDEAGFRAAAVIWLSLFVAGVVDLADLELPGIREATVVLVVAGAIPLALWVPYVWRRWKMIPHATAWTLAAAFALPYSVAYVVAHDSELVARVGITDPAAFLPLGAGASMAAAVFASAMMWRRLPASAWLVVTTAAACLLAVFVSEIYPGLPPQSAPAIVLCAGAVAVLLGVNQGGWHAVVCERGMGVVLLLAVTYELFAASTSLLILAGYWTMAAGLLVWWAIRLRPAKPAAQWTMVRAAGAWLRSVGTATGVFATVPIAVFLVFALATDRSSAQVLVSLRNAGLVGVSELELTRALLADQYLWRGSAGGRKTPKTFGSPLDLRVLPAFDRWSTAIWSRDFAAMEAEHPVGTGLVLAVEGRSNVVALSHEGSPGYALGVRRGDRIVGTKDDWMEKVAADGRLRVLPVDFPVTLTVVSQDGRERTVQVPAALHRERRVLHKSTLAVGGRPVGYIALRHFDPYAEREFVDAIASFRAAGVRTLVLDLRYNPGGLLYTSTEIAGAILGARGEGQTFVTTHHNPRYRDRDRRIRFRVPPGGGLDADQLVVITSSSTCSASELIVKGLEPYLPVATVGSTTCGKPVGSSTVDSGDWVYAVISFYVRNARGEGDYFDGLPPTCAATDDRVHELGDPQEASLREALHYIATGGCSASAS